MVYVSVFVPPDATAVIVPLLLPKHKGWVNDVLLMANTAGCVTITVVLAVHAFASVTIIV